MYMNKEEKEREEQNEKRVALKDAERDPSALIVVFIAHQTALQTSSGSSSNRSLTLNNN